MVTNIITKTENDESKIHSIDNITVRERVRGLLDTKIAQTQINKTLTGILRTIDYNDLIKVDYLFRNSQLFSHIFIDPEFRTHNDLNDIGTYTLIPREDLILNYINHRIGEGEEKIVQALDLFSKLNISIAEKNHDAIITTIQSIREIIGDSLTLIRKLSFIYAHFEKDSSSHRVCAEIFSSYNVNGINYGVMANMDTIGKEFNYLDLRHRFKEFTSWEKSISLERKFAYLAFFPISTSRETLYPIITASYGISIIDVTITLLAHRDLGVIQEELILSQSIEEAWRILSVEPEHIESLFSENDPDADSYAYRAAPAFLEYTRFRNLRASIQNIYDLPDFRALGNFDNTIAKCFFAQAVSVSSIVPSTSINPALLPYSFDNASAGVFVRSNAVVWLCDRTPDFSGLSAQQMATLMGNTSELDKLLSPRSLRTAASKAEQPFVKLILYTLLRAQSSSTTDNYNFKEHFQKYVNNYHNGNILDFIRAVDSMNNNTVKYFIDLLSETMLSQMPFLMPTANHVYEMRAQLLEWYTDITGRADYAEKAGQLRLDRKIAEVKGVINETRLNIDSVRFRQWIDLNKITDFSEFIRQETFNHQSAVDISDKSKRQSLIYTSYRDPTNRALKAILECYAEFCKNADYGIASFLGRRIRHGTFRGTLLNSLASTESPPGPINTQFQKWCVDFKNNVGVFVETLKFQEKSEKIGLMSAEIDTREKFQTCLVCLQHLHTESQKDQGSINIAPIIEEFCWFIFEHELKSVQAKIAKARTDWGQFKISSNDPDVRAFERSINVKIKEQFNTVQLWFRKPPNLSPVAELGHVLTVVINEEKSEYSGFSPFVDFIGDSGIELSGRIYYIVYDALKIIIGNAAKHGQHPGNLRITPELCETGNGTTLTVSVSSELLPNHNATNILKMMEMAAGAGAEGADIIEGLSGMRKLKKMEVERNILGFRFERPHDSITRISVTVDFPLKGIV
jgi:hypothetical protein